MSGDDHATGDDVKQAGEAGQRIGRLGRRYAIAIRVVTLVPIGAVAVAAADGPVGGAAAVAIGGLVGWSVVYVVLLRRGRTTTATMLDGVALCGLGLLTGVVTPGDWMQSGKTWIRPFVTFAAVGHQYSTPWRVGLPIGLAVCTTAALSAGLTQSGGSGLTADAVVTVVWSNVIAILARILFTLLGRAATRADRAIADAESARREQAVGESVRAEERVISDSLHDTAATTLLTVAVGQAAGLDDLLRRRAADDLRTLRAIRSGTRTGPVDLTSCLRQAAATNGVELHVHGPEQLDLHPDVARALADATGEALANVVRHANARSAHLHVEHDGTAVSIAIQDDGIGFDPGRVPETRRGLRLSVAARVAAVGGASEIESSTGHGTTIRLRWPA